MRKLKATKILAALACAAAPAWAAAHPEGGPPQRARVTDSRQQPDGVLLLGTAGGPLARAERAGIATLLTVNGRNYLVDAGEGVVHQMGKAGMQAPAAPLVFLTHLHDDHYAGLPALASFSFTLRSPRLDVYGPVGTADMVGGLVQVLGPSARIRAAEQGFARTPAEFAFAHEYGEGRVFADENVTVTALANAHYRVPADNPVAVSKSFSLRFAARGRIIVFTGDAGPTAALADFARGGDILIAEMASHADRESVPPFVREHMDKEHLSPLEVGKLAAAALLAPFPTGCGGALAKEAPATSEDAWPATEWVTLGTMGGPVPNATRGEPANLLVHNGQYDLVDAGDGAATAFLRAGGNFRSLRGIWISHIHFDHIGGLYGVLGLRLQTRTTTPLTIYGPPGTKAIVEGLIAAMQPSARSGFGVPGEVPIDPASTLEVVELEDGSTARLGDMTVTAAANTHYSFPAGSEEERSFKSLSFRFDMPGKSIVYTGDTGPSDAVTALAKGADLLVAELIDVEFTIANLRRRATDLTAEDLANMETHLRTHHITTADIGAMAAAAGVKSVVITHLAGGGGREPDAAERYVREVKQACSGEMRVASDLDRFVP